MFSPPTKAEYPWIKSEQRVPGSELRDHPWDQPLGSASQGLSKSANFTTHDETKSVAIIIFSKLENILGIMFEFKCGPGPLKSIKVLLYEKSD
jgi:hypothetical protein